MQTQSQQPADAAQLAMLQAKMVLTNRMRSGIGWFYWIAGLSLLNSVIYLAGATLTFIFGLGLTQVVDGIIAGIVEQAGPGLGWLRFVGLAINILIAGTCVLIAYFGQRRVRWPVIVGMVLYLLDGLLTLAFQDYLGAGFHLLALWGIWSGLKAMRQLEALDKPAGIPVTPVIGSL